MSRYGIKVSNKSVDDDKDTIFRTDLDTIKFDIGSDKDLNNFVKYTFPNNPPGPGIVGKSVYPIHTFKHNLGEIPAHSFRTYDYNFTGSYIEGESYEEGASYITGAGFVQQYFEYWVSSTDLQINYVVEDFSGGGTPFYNMTGATFGFKYTLYTNAIK